MTEPTSTNRTALQIGRVLLIALGIGLVALGGYLALVTVESGANPPYGVAGGLVAVAIGAVLVYVAVTTDRR